MYYCFGLQTFNNLCTLIGGPTPTLKVQGLLGAQQVNCCHQPLHRQMKILFFVEDPAVVVFACAAALADARVSHCLEHVNVEVQGAAIGRRARQVWQIWRAWQEVLGCIPLACLTDMSRVSVLCYCTAGLDGLKCVCIREDYAAQLS